MRFLEKITFIAGVARSGTSWVGQIFNSSSEVKFRFQPFFSYEFKYRVNEDSDALTFQHLFNEIYLAESSFLTQKDKRESGDYPIFKKDSFVQHLVFKENRYLYLIEPMMRKCANLKLLGIVRNPNAVLNSWMKNPKEFPPGSDPLKEWRFGDCKNEGHQDFFGYYKWKEVAGMFLDLHDKWPNRFYLLRYEDLVKFPIKETKKIFEYYGIKYGKQTDEFLKISTTIHKESPYSVFKDKSVVNNWRKELNTIISNEIESDLTGTRLEQFLR